MFPNNGIGILSSKDVIIPISVSPFFTHFFCDRFKVNTRFYLLSHNLPELLVSLIDSLLDREHHAFLFGGFIHI